MSQTCGSVNVENWCLSNQFSTRNVFFLNIFSYQKKNKIRNTGSIFLKLHKLFPSSPILRVTYHPRKTNHEVSTHLLKQQSTWKLPRAQDKTDFSVSVQILLPGDFYRNSNSRLNTHVFVSDIWCILISTKHLHAQYIKGMCWVSFFSFLHGTTWRPHQLLPVHI